jgi:hypothetical protein
VSRESRAEPADPTARTVLAHLRSLGYWVSYHELPASLLGTVPACVECHAVDPDGQQRVAKVVNEGSGDEGYQACCLLAEMAGVDLEG